LGTRNEAISTFAKEYKSALNAISQFNLPDDVARNMKTTIFDKHLKFLNEEAQAKNEQAKSSITENKQGDEK
jgi:hypothetical protein